MKLGAQEHKSRVLRALTKCDRKQFTYEIECDNWPNPDAGVMGVVEQPARHVTLKLWNFFNEGEFRVPVCIAEFKFEDVTLTTGRQTRLQVRKKSCGGGNIWTQSDR